MLANWFCAILSFWGLIFVGFLLLRREAIFTSVRFFLTANIFPGSLGFALCFVGMHSAAAIKWALTKSSYSSFAVGVFDIFWNAENLFLSVNIYLSLLSLLWSRDQSECTLVVVRAAFHRRLSGIFAVTIRWLEDTPSKEEYALQFNMLSFHFLFMMM